jgi:hypothetical protein
MSKSKSASRKLDPYRVQMAQRLQAKKHELAMEMVADRVRKDAEFAADVLKIAGDTLREDIKKDALETIAKAKTQALVDKWDKTGLLEGVSDISKCDSAVLIESQEKQLITPKDFEEFENAKSQLGEQCGGTGCSCQNH